MQQQEAVQQQEKESVSGLIGVVASIGAEFAVNAIDKALEERKNGLMGQFIANGVIKDLDKKAGGCLVVVRELFGSPTDNHQQNGEQEKEKFTHEQLNKARIQLRSATVNEVLVLEKNSWGVRKPKVFLGR